MEYVHDDSVFAECGCGVSPCFLALVNFLPLHCATTVSPRLPTGTTSHLVVLPSWAHGKIDSSNRDRSAPDVCPLRSPLNFPLSRPTSRPLPSPTSAQPPEFPTALVTPLHKPSIRIANAPILAGKSDLAAVPVPVDSEWCAKINIFTSTYPILAFRSFHLHSLTLA